MSRTMVDPQPMCYSCGHSMYSHHSEPPHSETGYDDWYGWCQWERCTCMGFVDQDFVVLDEDEWARIAEQMLTGQEA